MNNHCVHDRGVAATSWPSVSCRECGASGKVKDGSPFPPNSTRDVQWEMTYEEFVEKMRKHEAELEPFSAEMKEVIRWATQNHFDHFWRYTTEPEDLAHFLSDMAQCLSEPGAKPKPRPALDSPLEETLEEMIKLEHTLLLMGATLYGDPDPAPGYDAVYRWENEEGGIVAALVVNHEHWDGHAIELVVSNYTYTRYVRDEDELGKTINFFVNTRARYGGSKSLGESPLLYNHSWAFEKINP